MLLRPRGAALGRGLGARLGGGLEGREEGRGGGTRVRVRVCVQVCARVCSSVPACACRTACGHRCVRAHACTGIPARARAHACAHTRAAPWAHVRACVPARPGSPPPPVGAPRPSLPARAGVPVGRGWERGACVIMPVAMETICSPGAGAVWARGHAGGGGGGGERGCCRLQGPWQGQGSVGMVVALWGHHGSAGMAVAPWGQPQVRGDSHGSVGWSRPCQDGHRSVGTLRAPWGQSQLRRDVTAPGHRAWELLSPCPSRPYVPPVGWGGTGPLVGARAGEWDGHTRAQGHLVLVPTCWDPPGPAGTPQDPLGTRRPRQGWGAHRDLGGWPPGHHHTKTQDSCTRPPRWFQQLCNTFGLGTENLCPPRHSEVSCPPPLSPLPSPRCPPTLASAGGDP